MESEIRQLRVFSLAMLALSLFAHYAGQHEAARCVFIAAVIMVCTRRIMQAIVFLKT